MNKYYFETQILCRVTIDAPDKETAMQAVMEIDPITTECDVLEWELVASNEIDIDTNYGKIIGQK